MKIFCGAKFSPGYLECTDTRTPEQYKHYISLKKGVMLDTTKDKSGKRHSTAEVLVSPEDIVALSAKYFQEYESTLRELTSRNGSLSENYRALINIFSEISSILNGTYPYEDPSIPDSEKLLVIGWLVNSANTGKEEIELPKWFDPDF